MENDEGTDYGSGGGRLVEKDKGGKSETTVTE